jgi:uncharacterized membrane protein YbhN (UPF0104 family)
VLAGRLAYLTWITMALIVLCPLLLLVPGLAEGAARRLHARLARGAEVEAGTALFLRALRGSIGYGLFFPLTLTVLAFGVNFFQGHLLARSLGMDIPFQDVGGLLAIASLLGLVPISLSGLGVREVIFALVFPLLGYPASSGVGFGLLIFAALYLFVVLLGFVGWQLAPPPVGPAPGREDGPVAAGRADAEAEATGTSRGARLFQR